MEVLHFDVPVTLHNEFEFANYQIYLHILNSGDIPQFLMFYLIILVSFSAALNAMILTDLTSAGQALTDFFKGVFDLIQVTVNMGLPPGSVFHSSNVSEELLPLYQIILTCFYVIVVLMFINILIAMINNTYTAFKSYNDSLLIMEKYNIMCGLDVSLVWLSKYFFLITELPYSLIYILVNLLVFSLYPLKLMFSKT